MCNNLNKCNKDANIILIAVTQGKINLIFLTMEGHFPGKFSRLSYFIGCKIFYCIQSKKIEKLIFVSLWWPGVRKGKQRIKRKTFQFFALRKYQREEVVQNVSCPIAGYFVECHKVIWKSGKLALYVRWPWCIVWKQGWLDLTDGLGHEGVGEVGMKASGRRRRGSFV